MKTTTVSLALPFLALAVYAQVPETRVPAPAEALAIVGATLVDGTGAAPIADAAIVVNGDRITAAGPRAQVEVPKGARIVDAKGRWVIPGLVDAHIHWFQSGGLYTRPDVADFRKRVPYEQEIGWIRERLPYTFSRYLASGITAVVDVGGPMWNFEVRDAARTTALAPRVAVAGPLISTYSPPALKSDDPAIVRVKDPAEAKALVLREVERKPDLVKIWFIRLPGTSLEKLEPIVKAVIDESHAHGVRVAVHATELETARAAVRLGCDVLVHSVEDKPVDEEFTALVKERGVIYTTTLVVYEGYREVLGRKVELTDVERALGDPAVIASWEDLKTIPEDELPASVRQPWPDRSTKTSLENLKRMQDAGAIVAAGTDAGNIGTLHGPSLHRELELMAEAGLTPLQVLVAATRNAARVFAKEPEFGTVEPGMLADLLILTADPTADIRNARKIESVIKGGRVLDLAAMPAAPAGRPAGR